MKRKTVSLEEQFWNTLQQSLKILGPLEKEPANITFSVWYKEYGKCFVETLKTKLLFYASAPNGQRFLKQAIYSLDVGLDGYESHNDMEYLSDMTALAIESLYREISDK